MLNCRKDKFWGQHLLLNCKEGNDNVKDIEKVKEFVNELVEKIDMEKHGEIFIDRFGEGDLFGISCCQFIKTSSIVGHFCDNTKDFYLDIFSCKKFDTLIVLNLVRTFFSPIMSADTCVDRGV